MKVILFIFLITIFSIFTQDEIIVNHDKGNKKNIDKPNIVFLVADDMGFADPEFIGGNTNTPNINKLAAEGQFFKNFYAAAPNCSPSRAGLLTGKSPSKIGMYSYRPYNHQMHLLNEQTNLAQILKDENYNTAHFGKWHLGSLVQNDDFNHPNPSDHGFEFSFGTEMNAIPSHLNPINFIMNGVAVGEVKGYSCEILANKSIDWLKNHSNKPFFLYVAFHEPHEKVSSPPNLISNYPNLSKRDAKYLANIDNLDLAIGKIIDYLEKKDIIDNTLIFFSSDNGSYRWDSNGGLRTGKSYIYEGGIHVPGIIKWSKISSKRSIYEVAGFVDMVPTICDILDIPVSKDLDGTSLLPVLKGEKLERDKPLFWFFYRTVPEIAIRLGDYMLMGSDTDTVHRTHSFTKEDLNYIENITITNFELYNLKEDLNQKINIFNHYDHDKDSLKSIIVSILDDIKKNMIYWDSLPDWGSKKRQIKSKYMGGAEKWIK